MTIGSKEEEGEPVNTEQEEDEGNFLFVWKKKIVRRVGRITPLLLRCNDPSGPINFNVSVWVNYLLETLLLNLFHLKVLINKPKLMKLPFNSRWNYTYVLPEIL